MGNYYLYMIAYYSLRFLPLSIGYGLARVLADLQYFLSVGDRKAVEDNLKAVLKTDRVPPDLVRGVFRNFGKYLTDFFLQTRIVTDDFIKNRVRLGHTEFLNEILKEGKGCIFVSAHLGNWEIAGAVMSKLGYPLSVVALPHQDPRVNKFFNDQREFFGVTVISTNGAIRRCLEHLRANRIVAILAERDFSPQGSGLIMNFLGRPTLIPKGAALFSLKTGAPIVPCFFLRRDDGNFEVSYANPVYPPAVANGRIDEAQVRALMEKYIPTIEEQIKRKPSQWLMFRRFWTHEVPGSHTGT